MQSALGRGYGREVPLIDEPPRPQGLFVGFSPDDPAVDAMAELTAGYRVLGSGIDMHELRLADWDFVVAMDSPPQSWDGADSDALLFALSFGARSGRIQTTGEGTLELAYNQATPSPTLILSDDTPDPFARLITQDLLPRLRDLDQRPYLVPTYAENAGLRDARGAVYLTDADRNPMVAYYPRALTSGKPAPLTTWCLCLPIVPEHPELWLRAALDVWRESAPERFPGGPVWRDASEYQTQEQRRLHASLAELAAERLQVEAALNAREAALESDLVAADSAAEAGSLRLLTDDGPTLVEAVTVALEELGFVVVDADSELAEGVAKAEDLRLSDPGDDDWTNITEVKGHTGGAKASVLLKLSQRAERFALRAGALPTARWYIANQFRESDPRKRPVVLRGADDDLEVFGQGGGLVIDTRDLFTLAGEVADGERTADSARGLLKAARGRFNL
jgi:hypothetical protein